MREFELNGNQYRIGKLNAFEQSHVLKRIMPLIPPLIPLFQAAAREGLRKDISSIAQLAAPFTASFSNLPDEASDFVLLTCLSAVQRFHAGAWSPIYNKPRKAWMFDEQNDLGTMLQIVVRVIQEELGPFFQGILMSQTAPGTQPTA